MQTRVCLLLAFALIGGIPSPSRAQTQQRPISDFLNAQTPDDYVCWTDPVSQLALCFDHFGERAKLFGLDEPTTYDGKVTVRTLADGTAHVSVLLHTVNAICWGFTFDGEDTFGYRPHYVSLGLGQPSFGDGVLRIDFTMASPESPLPSLTYDIGSDAYPLETVSTSVSCRGQLRYGSGFPDGTPGFGQTTQTGLLDTGVPQGCPPEKDADCFPAERVQFKPAGH